MCGSRVKFGVRAGSVVGLKWEFGVRFGIEVWELVSEVSRVDLVGV